MTITSRLVDTDHIDLNTFLEVPETIELQAKSTNWQENLETGSLSEDTRERLGLTAEQVLQRYTGVIKEANQIFGKDMTVDSVRERYESSYHNAQSLFEKMDDTGSNLIEARKAFWETGDEEEAKYIALRILFQPSSEKYIKEKELEFLTTKFNLGLTDESLTFTSVKNSLVDRYKEFYIKEIHRFDFFKVLKTMDLFSQEDELSPERMLEENPIRAFRIFGIKGMAQGLELSYKMEEYLQDMDSSVDIEKILALFLVNPESEGIRTRGIYTKYILKEMLQDETLGINTMLSFASGCARQVIEVLNELNGKKAIGIDMDPMAIKMAKTFAEKFKITPELMKSFNEFIEKGNEDSALTLIEGNLTKLFYKPEIFKELSNFIIDEIGLFEYLSKKQGEGFISGSDRLNPIAIVLANMLPRLDKDFFFYVPGWHPLFVRSTNRMKELVDSAVVPNKYDFFPFPVEIADPLNLVKDKEINDKGDDTYAIYSMYLLINKLRLSNA